MKRWISWDHGGSLVVSNPLSFVFGKYCRLGFWLVPIKHVAFIVFVVGSVWLTVRVKSENLEKLRLVHKALQLQTMKRVESTEISILTREVELDREHEPAMAEYTTIVSTKVRYDYEALGKIKEQLHEKKAQLRSEETTWSEILNITDEERLMLLNDFNEKYKEKNASVNRLRDNFFSKGLCVSRMLRGMCRAFGRIAELERKTDAANQDANDALREYRISKDLQEMEIAATDQWHLLEHQQEEKIASLEQTAAWWAQKYHHDLVEALHWNNSLHEVQKDIEELNRQIGRDNDIVANLSAIIPSLMEQAEEAHQSARHFSLAIILLSVFPLAISLSRVLPVLWAWVLDFESILYRKKARTAFHCVMHAASFIICARSYAGRLCLLDRYSSAARFAMICGFTIFAAFLQTIMFQVVPDVLFWGTSRRYALPQLLKNAGLRYSILLIVFSVEFVVIWLSPFQGILLDPSASTAWVASILFIVGGLGYYVNVDRRCAFFPDRDEEAGLTAETRNSDSSSESTEPTETTALVLVRGTEQTSGESVQSETEGEFARIYLEGILDHVSIEGHEESPFCVSLEGDLIRLQVMLDIFVIFLLVRGMLVAWGSRRLAG